MPLLPISPRPLLFRLLPILGLVLAFIPPAPAEDRASLERVLKIHGIPSRLDTLAAFLKDGWTAAPPPSPLPQSPTRKTDLCNIAWQLLILRHPQVQAMPGLERQLGGLALQYAKGAFPAAIQNIMDDDLGAAPPKNQTQPRAEIAETLQYNGMIAAGYFTEATEDNLKTVRQILQTETRPLIRVEYSQTLGLLGDTTVLSELIQETGKANRDSSVAAARILGILLGQNFKLTANMAIAPRKDAAKEIQTWWEKVRKDNLAIDRAQAIERILRPIPARAPDTATIRGLLRVSSDLLDTANQHGSRTAWDTLQKMPKDKLLDNLKPILDDEREDLDIRQEALRWYALTLKADAKNRLKKLARDPNPEIATAAKAYLKKI